MKLYINEKVFSLHDKFYIYDENGNNIYEVSSKFLSLWKKTRIYDMNGSQVLYIEQEGLRIPAAYKIYENGEYVCEISRVAGWFTQNYQLSNGYQIKGRTFPLKVTIYDEKDKIIGTIEKKVFSIGDKYEIEIFDETHKIITLAIAVTIANDVNRGQSGHKY